MGGGRGRWKREVGRRMGRGRVKMGDGKRSSQCMIVVCICTCIDAVQHGFEGRVVATLGLVQEQAHLLHLGHAQLEESLCHNAVVLKCH